MSGYSSVSHLIAKCAAELVERHFADANLKKELLGFVLVGREFFILEALDKRTKTGAALGATKGLINSSDKDKQPLPLR